jgi:hypothetical protein
MHEDRIGIHWPDADAYGRIGNAPYVTDREQVGEDRGRADPVRT